MAQLSYRRHRFPAEIIQQLDDKTINDDEDAVMELRMMHKVRRLHTFDLATPALSAYEALEIATLNGAKATGFAKEVGALVPGMKGDAILVDLDRVARDPWIDPEFDIAHAFVERAMGADVPTVVIGGKIVVENHRPRTIDVEGLYREVREFCAKGLTPEQRARADFLRKIKPYVQAWYGTWHETMLAHYQLRVGAGATAVIRLRLRQCHTRRRGTVRHAVCANPRGAPPRGRRVRIRPVFVQNRCLAHASWDAEVRALCHTHNVIYQAFSLLSGNRQVLLKPRVAEIARHHNKTVPQVVFRFAVQLGMLPLTGTTDGAHMRHSLDIFDFTLTRDETETMLVLGRSR